jgi:Uncharacterized membrane protein
MKKGFVKKLLRGFKGSVGDVVFGMEDGVVSVFGLVFGMALSVQEHDVLLAGIAGGAAGSISMMAGAYLDAKSEQSEEEKLNADLAQGQESAVNQTYVGMLTSELDNMKVSTDKISEVKDLLEKYPELVSAMRVTSGKQQVKASPIIKAIWMFVADLVASAIPIFPFFIFDLEEARIWSIVLTTIMLIVLGIGRSRLADASVGRVVFETVVVAYLAALGGILLMYLLNFVS